MDVDETASPGCTNLNTKVKNARFVCKLANEMRKRALLSNTNSKRASIYLGISTRMKRRTYHLDLETVPS